VSKDHVHGRTFPADTSLASEWYEAVATTQAILKLFGSVFHFTFTKLDPATVVPGVPSEQIVWDPSMELYAVYDSDSNQYLGTLYLDNFHRSSDDAISSSAYSGSIGSIYVRPDGSVSPAAVYIKNYFDQPTGDTPTLLDSDSVSQVAFIQSQPLYPAS
jgi:metallopeptidase MepB